MNSEDLKSLQNTAVSTRKDIISMLNQSKSGHPGGSLSAVEILSYLYFYEMKLDNKNPNWDERDRFVLSKGHAAPVLYSVLAQKEYFDKGELLKLRKTGAMLQGHPDMKGTPGIDMSTGSLGQGLSAANGMALAAKLDNKDYRVYVLLGDGELQEGQVWEAVMTSAHYKLNNVTAFIDYNGLQIDGKNSEVMTISPIEDKFKAFGWNTICIDGHDFMEIDSAVKKAKDIKDKPTVIVAKTTKGKGVSFMENEAGWHGTAPNDEQAAKAIDELEVCKNG